jgi:hypothetical protein
MFTRILVLLGYLFFAGAALADEEFVPKVDTSSIKSWSDYERAAGASFRLYETRATAAFQESEKASLAAFQMYAAFAREELLKLRRDNFDIYLAWLDAKEIGDDKKRLELEQIPALSRFKSATAAKYREYEEVKKRNSDRYEARKNQAYKVYETEKKMARDAYEAHQRLRKGQ